METLKSKLTGCLLGLILLCSVSSGWPQELIGADNAALLSFQRALAGSDEPGTAVSTPSTATERGTLANDLLRGNGTRAGYILSHGGIVPNSETVSVDGGLQARNRDYYLDISSGNLAFSSPVKQNQSIRVSYRYVKGEDQNRSAVGVPGLALSFGQGASVGLTLAHTGANAKQPYDVTTYGLKLSSSLGGKSTMTNMMYLSSPKKSSGIPMALLLDEPQTQSSAPIPKADNLFLHNSDWQTGKLNVKLDYQDVGKDFAGFTALREQKAAPEEILKQLEQEKGISRLGLQASYDLGNSSSAALALKKISEDGAEILEQSISIGSEQLKLTADTLNVDKDFTRFRNLAEKESTQWAKLAGVNQSNIQLSYAPSEQTSALIGLRNIEDGGGDIVSRTLSFTHKHLKLSADFQEVDEGFKKFAGLNDPSLALLSGAKRSNIQLGFKPESGFGGEASFLRVSDDTGSAVKQSVSVGDERWKLGFSTQEMEDSFTHVLALEDAQWAREVGMKRTDMNISMAPFAGMDPKSEWNAYTKSIIEDPSGDFSAQTLRFATRNLSLYASDSRIDGDFRRLKDLGQTDYRKMALEIYRQFDPAASDKSVSRQDLLHMTKEAGIERRNIRGDFNSGSLSAALQLLNIGDHTGGIQRRSLSLSGKDFSITGLVQSIDDEFVRVATLSPTERLHFGSEYGMNRTNLSGDFKLSSGLKLSSSFARVSTEDAGLSRYGLSLSGKGFDLAANFRDIDPEFARISDLADTDRRKLALERGMKAYDLSLGYQVSKSVRINSFFYDASHQTDDLFRRQLRNSIVFNPTHGPKLSLLLDQMSSGSHDSQTDYLRQKFTFDHSFGGVALGAVYDSARTERPNGDVVAAMTQALRLQTDAKKTTSFSAEWEKTEEADGTFSEAQSYTVKSKVSSQLTLAGSHSSLQTSAGEKGSNDFSLIGKVFGDTTLTLKFGESIVGQGILGKVRQLSIAPGGQKDYGALKNVGWKFAFSEVRKPGLPLELDGSALLSCDIFGLKFGYEHLTGVIKANKARGVSGGDKTLSRSFSLATAKDSTSPLQFDLLYRDYDSGPGARILIRKYNASWSPNASTKLTYAFSSYPDSSLRVAGAFDPLSEERIRLTTALTKTLNLVGRYDRVENFQKNTSQGGLSLGLAGSIPHFGLLEASYGYDRVATVTGRTRAHTYRLKYDMQVSAENFLTLAGRYTDYSDSDPSAQQDDLVFQVDFRTIFR